MNNNISKIIVIQDTVIFRPKPRKIYQYTTKHQKKNKTEYINFWGNQYNKSKRKERFMQEMNKNNIPDYREFVLEIKKMRGEELVYQEINQITKTYHLKVYQII